MSAFGLGVLGAFGNGALSETCGVVFGGFNSTRSYWGLSRTTSAHSLNGAPLLPGVLSPKDSCSRKRL